MNWDNWIYLIVGLAVGIGISLIFKRASFRSTPDHTTQVSDNLLQQLHQTELAYHMAREMSKFKAGFLARTTHEVRSPLNGLIGLHQLILSDLCENPQEEKEFIAQAHERALILLKLIDEIMNVARTEHGTNKLEIQPVSLNQLLSEVHKVIYLLAANRNYPLKIVPPEPETYVLADPNRLRQILVSLTDTCIAQMLEGSIHISATTTPENNCVQIWLDVPTHAIPTQEPIDLMASVDKDNYVMSPGMKLWLNHTLLEVMGAKLEIVPPQTSLAEDISRMQVSIPLVTLEVGLDTHLANQI